MCEKSTYGQKTVLTFAAQTTLNRGHGNAIWDEDCASTAARSTHGKAPPGREGGRQTQKKGQGP